MSLALLPHLTARNHPLTVSTPTAHRPVLAGPRESAWHSSSRQASACRMQQPEAAAWLVQRPMVDPPSASATTFILRVSDCLGGMPHCGGLEVVPSVPLALPSTGTTATTGAPPLPRPPSPLSPLQPCLAAAAVSPPPLAAAAALLAAASAVGSGVRRIVVCAVSRHASCGVPSPRWPRCSRDGVSVSLLSVGVMVGVSDTLPQRIRRRRDSRPVVACLA